MILYILEVSIGWALFYLLYHLVLRQTTFFTLNRWYLVLSFIVGLVLPLMPPLWNLPEPAQPTAAEMVNWELWLANLQYLQEMQVIEVAPEKASVNWWLVVYWLGVLMMAGRLLYGMFQIGRYFFAGKKTYKGIHRLVFTHKEHLPFSFFRWIFWGKHPSVNTPEADRMLKHEQAHIRQGHTLDVMLVEVVSTIAWFSPLVFFYRKALRANHEFLADAAVTKEYKIKEYGHLLIQQSLSGPQIALVNHLIHSQLKNRIIMMTKKRSTRLSLLRYMLALPVIALLLLAFTYDEAYGLDELPVFSDEFPELSLPSFSSEETEEVIPATVLAAEETEEASVFSEGENVSGLPFLANELFKGTLQLSAVADQADTTKPEPLIVLNGQVVEGVRMMDVPAEKVSSVNVLKGNAAIEKYGDKGKNGVVEIDCPKCDMAVDNPPAVDFSDKLILLNGVRISYNNFQTLDHLKIKSIDVRKGDFAVEKYGDAAKNGVVEVYCPDCEVEKEVKEKSAFRIRGGEGAPLFVINGVMQKKSEDNPAKELEPDQIKSVNVLKGEAAIKKYGEEGENGVVEIDCPSCEDEKAVKEEPTSKIRIRAKEGTSAEPLYVLNDEIIDHLDLKQIEPNNIKAITVLKDDSAVELYGEAGRNGVVIIDCPKCDVEALKEKEVEITSESRLLPQETFMVVEEMPLFQGCDGQGMSREEQMECSRRKLLEFVYNKIEYPADKEQEGTVVAEFVVTKSGKITSAKIVRSMGADFDQAVLAVVDQLPSFKAGRQRGQKVNVKMMLPVKFKPVKGVAAKINEQAEIKKRQLLESELSNNNQMLSLQSFSATPNPTKGRLHLRFEAAAENTLIRVLDASGQEVLRKQLRNFNGLYDEYLNLDEAPKGMLLIHISQGERQFVHKIVAQ